VRFTGFAAAVSMAWEEARLHIFRSRNLEHSGKDKKSLFNSTRGICIFLPTTLEVPEFLAAHVTMMVGNPLSLVGVIEIKESPHPLLTPGDRMVGRQSFS
jgi:hypothetical protein